MRDEPRWFDWLFLDLNSYFASVEQQENPRLRGRPVAVVPVDSDYTCAIAASHEAKACGIKTGTMVKDARLRCPQLIRVLADHEKYVRYHKRVLKEIDRHIPVEIVASVDEMACRLTGRWREPERAHALALEIKDGLRRNVGECITCSIGLSTNRLLAKLASDLEKPDGLVALHPHDLPGAFAGLTPRDFCGIGPRMEKRLARAGITTVRQLWHCPPEKLRAFWGSVEGERFWHALRGVEIPPAPPNKSCVGHSHVLDPLQRPPALAELVARRLLLKAASRLRGFDHLAGALTVAARLERGGRLAFERRFTPLCDSVSLQHIFEGLWHELLSHSGQERIKKVSVTLHALQPIGEARQLELSLSDRPLPPDAALLGDKRERVSRVIDQLTKKFGRDAVTIGFVPGQGSSFTGAKIAFNRMPDLDDFEAPRRLGRPRRRSR